MSNYTNNEIIHIKAKNGIEYIQFKKLNDYKEFFHAITLRHGGVSTGELESLNFRISSDKEKENRMENLSRLVDALNVDLNYICKGTQAHTTNIQEINEQNKDKYLIQNACDEPIDAYITRGKNLFSLVTTADCVPVIIFDPIRKITANIHSGWKGTLDRIVQKTILKLIEEYNSNPENLIVALGPAIGKCCFTSKDEQFKNKFVDVFGMEDRYIYIKNDTYHIDLKYLIKQDLFNLGVLEENILNADICTKCNVKDFYSYRYATENGKNDYGLFATIVGRI